MADWYVSSTAYAALPAWQATHAYNIGDIIRQVSPVGAGLQWAYRCTTAGTSGGSEPTWGTAPGDGNTISSGTATFTNVSGESTYNWTAPFGTLYSYYFNNTNKGAGDRIFISSDHVESLNSSVNMGGNITVAYGVIQHISVNKAGSVPPVAADYLAGANVSNSASSIIWDARCNMYYQGLTLGGASNMNFNQNGLKQHYLRSCSIVFTGGGGVRITSSNDVRVILDNTPITFSSTGQFISASGGAFELIWINTPNPLGGATFPTTLITSASPQLLFTFRGLDLSSISGTLLSSASGTTAGAKLLLDSCKIASGVTRYSTASASNVDDEVELVNCYTGSAIVSERYTAAGTLTTETTITLTNGAADDAGAFSHKMVTTANSDKYCYRFEGFWLDVENTITGASKTATVEIISSTPLNNDEIILVLQYEGTNGSSQASFNITYPASPLTVGSAVASSTASWNSSPSTPQKQHLQASFTPQHAGRLRAQVWLGKPSTTVYVNPQITVS